jgi:beta-lactamase regulating signal transducer with metallopeptidase domain
MTLEIVLKASALLATGATTYLLCRRWTSAATRHLILTLSLASVLALPLASFVLPPWDIVVRTMPRIADDPAPIAARADEAPPLDVSASAATLGPTPVPRASSFSWPIALLMVYVAGVAAMLLHGAAAFWMMRRFARRAVRVEDPDWIRPVSEAAASIGIARPVTLLRSCEHNIPVVFGLRRGTIVIPAIADTWSDERRRAVIRHELAHVARGDCLTEMLALACRTIYWFHPAVWWTASRLRIEAELACDDRVIAAGTEGREYASHLLEIAYSLNGGRAPALAVAMARPRQLEGRMLAALDRTRNRRSPERGFGVAVAVAGATLVCAVAAARPVTVMAEPYLHEGETAPATVEAREQTTQDEPGTWEIRPTNTDGIVHLRIVERRNSSSGSNVAIAQFDGLTAAQLSGAGGPIQFRLRRDAGTFTFEGVIRRGVGAGTFSFTPDASFPAELVKRGFARPSPADQYQLARHDIGFAFVDELNRQGYAKPSTAELVRAGQHGVNPAYLREMGGLGYRLGSLDPLITLRDHGVTPDYVRALAELGHKGLSADEIRNARDHGVSADYVRAMRDAGYGSLPMAALVNARDHGVSPEFVRGLADAGHSKLPLDELIRVRDHGVSPEYVRDLGQLGHKLAIAEFVNARDHGVSVEYVRELAALGYNKVPMAGLVRARDHGVSVQFVRDLKALGYDNLSLDDLITLRDHGVTADRVKAANARAGTRLPVDMLKSLARNGGLR